MKIHYINAFYLGYWLYKTQSVIKKNTKIATLGKVEKTYNIEFEIYPLRFDKGWRSILHLTTSGNQNVYGSRIPGIWFYSTKGGKTSTLYVCNAINGNKNYCFTTKNVPLKSWTQIRVGQKLEGSKFIYFIYINNKRVLRMVNTRPMVFENVKMYVGDPWYLPQEAYIRNFKITGNFLFCLQMLL